MLKQDLAISSEFAEWPADGLETVPNCPVCRSRERQLAYGGLTDQVFRCAPGKWDIYRCGACGSGYLDPRPNLASIGLAYKNYYTHAPIGVPKPESGSPWRQWRTSERNGFLNRHYGYQLQPATSIQFFISQRRQRRFDRFTGYLRFTSPGARVLDIGCGNGSFLLQMRLLGWETAGVESDAAAVEQARKAGLDVHLELSPRRLWPDGFFDAITMFHVMEHLHDPLQQLSDCRQLLKPGGQLMIATPNYDAVGREYFGPDWRGLEIPRHLVLFTEKSLWAAMERAGFAVNRPLRPNLNARNMFRISARLRRQRFGNLALSGWRTNWLAFKADQLTKRDPAKTEELILLARKV
jgi:2-polyprenyl-3-methyl-5-hydroxy-6-metoxy-1,4-benzoquinol methylase